MRELNQKAKPYDTLFIMKYIHYHACNLLRGITSLFYPEKALKRLEIYASCSVAHIQIGLLLEDNVLFSSGTIKIRWFEPSNFQSIWNESSRHFPLVFAF